MAEAAVRTLLQDLEGDEAIKDYVRMPALRQEGWKGTPFMALLTRAPPPRCLPCPCLQPPIPPAAAPPGDQRGHR